MGNPSNRSNHFDFLDRLAGLFRPSGADRGPEPKPIEPQNTLAAMSTQFEQAIGRLERMIEKQQGDSEGAAEDWRRRLPRVDEKEKNHREQVIHRRIREDIEAAHAHLETGISPAEVDSLRDYLERAAAVSADGERSHEILSRCRHSILGRVHREAGALALKTLDELLERRGESWPQPIPRDPSRTPEETAAIVRRKQAQVRQDFLNYGIRRSSLLIVGIVEAWKADYPDRGTPLWQSVVLEAMATGLRARLMQRFSDRLRQDQGILEARAAELLGAEMAELNRTLQGGVTSLQDAHRVVSSSMKILDEIIPGLAWEHLQQVMPEARA